MDSSVTIVSKIWLDDRAIWIPVAAAAAAAVAAAAAA
jgi:hypothetical protein